MPDVTITLTGEEAVAVQWMANRKAITPAQLLRVALRDELTTLVRLFRERRWEVRRKALEADPTLAAPVDAAAEAP